MEERPLGRSGLTVPAFGMGTWRTFDVRGVAAERRAHTIVDESLAVSARLIDSRYWGTAEQEQQGMRKAYQHLAGHFR